MVVVTVFVCAACGRALTCAVQRLDAVPERPRQDVGTPQPPTIPAGTWALDPQPQSFDPAGEPTGQVHCPVLNPQDLLPELPRHPDPRRTSGCCGWDGRDGPNLLCPGCHADVATVSDDCWTYVEARLEPAAVRQQ
jgi:hypothetical protein